MKKMKPPFKYCMWTTQERDYSNGSPNAEAFFFWNTPKEFKAFFLEIIKEDYYDLHVDDVKDLKTILFHIDKTSFEQSLSNDLQRVVGDLTFHYLGTMEDLATHHRPEARYWRKRFRGLQGAKTTSDPIAEKEEKKFWKFLMSYTDK